MINDRHRLPGQTPDQQTWTAMAQCCWIVAPQKRAEAQEEWCNRLIKEVYWSDGSISDRDRVTQDGQINIIKHARIRGVEVFTSRNAPRPFVSKEDFGNFLTTKRKYMDDVDAYRKAVVDLKDWQDKYGAEASAVVDDDDDDAVVVLTPPGQEGDAKRARNQKLLAAAVCVDCTNPNCGCAALAPKMA